MKFTFAPAVSTWSLADGTIQFRDSRSGRAFALKNRSSRERALVRELKDGLTEESLAAARGDSSTGSLVQLLESKNWIAPRTENPFAGDPREKLYRFLEAAASQPAADVLAALAAKKILVIGCGGTGAAVAQHLAASGLREFVLVDDDLVQASNLNRQAMFTYHDIGSPKTEALARALRARIPEMKIDRRELRITGTEDVRRLIESYRPDFVFCGADQPAIHCHIWVAEACRENAVPCVFGGVGISEGSWGPLLAQREGFDEFIERMHGLAAKYDAGSLSIVEGSLSMTNMLIATLLAMDVFTFLTGGRALSSGRKMKIDFGTLIAEPL